MSFACFVTVWNDADPAQPVPATLHAALVPEFRRLLGLLRVELHSPAAITTYHRPDPAPALALRLDFATLPAAEAQLLPDGGLHALVAAPAWRALPATASSCR